MKTSGYKQVAINQWHIQAHLTGLFIMPWTTMQKEEGEGGTESLYRLARPLDSEPETAFLVLIQALLETWWP